MRTNERGCNKALGGVPACAMPWAMWWPAKAQSLLMDSGVDLPGLHAGDPARIALEGYPGLLAREVLGARSYKSDARARQTVERQTARRDLVDALRAGRTRLGLRLCTTEAQRDVLIDDASADRLDAVLCLMQAAWASTRVRYGLPENVDPIEGWIVSAG